MAAQYDVNLEKCALLKCLCGSAFAAGQAPVRSLALKISGIFGHTLKVYIYTHTHTYTHIYTHTYTYIHTHIHTIH